MSIKSQMSLEVTIALVIFLIVGIVTVGFFVGKMMNAKRIRIESREIMNNQFQEQCESLCQEYKKTNRISELEKFCSAKMTQTDLNKNGKIDSIKATTKVLDICEDAVYCFHLYPCGIGSKTLEWADCRKAVCDYYTESYSGDSNKADMKVFELFPGVGSCEIPKEENWWEMYFGEKPCTEPPTELYLKDCIYDETDDTIECKTNCKYDGNAIFVVAVNSYLYSAKIPVITTPPSYGQITFLKDKIKVRVIPEDMANPPLKTLKGNDWNIILTCDLPKGDIHIIISS